MSSSYFYSLFLFLSFAFYFLWHPSLLFKAENSLWIKGIWLFVLINIYFISFTFIATAYDSYLAKIASNDTERLTVSQYKTLFASLGMIVVLPFIAYHNIALASNGILLISVLLLAICCLGITQDKTKENFSKNIKKKTASNQRESFSFFKNLKYFRDKKYFLYFLLVVLLMDAGVNIFLKNLDYYIVHVLLPKDSLLANLAEQRERLKLILFASFSLSLLLALPFWKWYAQKTTMLKGAKIGLFFLMFLFPSFLFFTNHFTSYVLIVLVFILIGFFYSAFTLVGFALLGQFAVKEKQVGLLFGLNIFVKKIGLILGLFLFSLIVEVFTFLDLVYWSFKSMGGMISLLTVLAYFFFLANLLSIILAK